jgi:hypothetical protein
MSVMLSANLPFQTCDSHCICSRKPLRSCSSVNLIDNEIHKNVRAELIRLLGTALQADPRWIGFWAEFRIARFDALPKEAGDMQIFTTSW